MLFSRLLPTVAIGFCARSSLRACTTGRVVPRCVNPEDDGLGQPPIRYSRSIKHTSRPTREPHAPPTARSYELDSTVRTGRLMFQEVAQVLRRGKASRGYWPSIQDRGEFVRLALGATRFCQGAISAAIAGLPVQPTSAWAGITDGLIPLAKMPDGFVSSSRNSSTGKPSEIASAPSSGCRAWAAAQGGLAPETAARRRSARRPSSRERDYQDAVTAPLHLHRAFHRPQVPMHRHAGAKLLQFEIDHLDAVCTDRANDGHFQALSPRVQVAVARNADEQHGRGLHRDASEVALQMACSAREVMTGEVCASWTF